jgi:hypothetical protein
MAEEAAVRALGAPELAGTLVNPKGLAKKMTKAAAAGVVGGAAGAFANRMVSSDPYDGAPDVPEFGRVGYVTVSAEEIALLKTKTGAIKMKVTDEVLARVPRSQITSADLDKGALLSHLKIDFSNGVSWEFDVPKQGKKTALRVIEALGGTVS